MTILSRISCSASCVVKTWWTPFHRYNKSVNIVLGSFSFETRNSFVVMNKIFIIAESLTHSGIWEESILLTIAQPASYDAGIRGKPLGGFPPNPLSLVLTEWVRGSHRVAPMMPKGEVFRTAFPNFSS